MKNLFPVVGGKFRFSAQDRDLAYLFWRIKNRPIPSDIILLLADGPFTFCCKYNVHHFSKKDKSFYREQYKKTCSMLIVGIIKADIPIWTKSTLDNKFSLVPYV